MKYLIKLFLILIFFCLLAFPVSAEGDIEGGLLNDAVKSIDEAGFNFSGAIEEVKSGAFFDLKNVLKKLSSMIFSEFNKNLNELIRLVTAAVLSGILCNLKLGEESIGVAQVSFFASYGLVAAMVINSFYGLLETALSVINVLRIFMQALLPSLLAVISAGGGAVTGAALTPALFGAIQIITFAAEKFLLPLIFTVTALCIVNNLSARFHITRLIELLRQIIKWSLGILLTVFVGMLGLQGLSTAFLDGIAGKTVRYALCNFIPLVGGVLADSVDAVLYSCTVVKNTVGIAGIVTLILICLPPVVKITALGIMYRLAAGVTEPAADKRIVNLFSDVAGSITQVSAILLIVCVMFIISIAILIMLTAIPSMVK